MNKTTKPVDQTNAPTNAAAIAMEAGILHAADAWQVKGFSVWDAVKTQMAAEIPNPSQFRADALLQSVYETHTGGEPAMSSARLAALMAHLEETQPEAVAQARAEANRIPTIDLDQYKPEASAIAAVPAEVARAHRVVPIRKVENKLWVAMENPRDTMAVDAIRMASRCMVIPLASVPEGALDYELARAYPQKETPPADNRTSENATAELVALVRDLQNEVRELKQEVQGLKKQVAAQQVAPPPLDARPAAYPAPRVLRATPAAQPPFPLFRD